MSSLTLAMIWLLAGAPAQTDDDATEAEDVESVDEEDAPDPDAPPASAAPVTPPPKGNTMMAGAMAGAAACIAAPCIGMCPVAIIPCFGQLAQGAMMGALGWLVGSLAGGKRLPLGYLVTAGALGILGVFLAQLPGYALLFVGNLLYGVNPWLALLVVVIGYTTMILAALLGVLGTSVAIGLVAAFTGRGVVKGESTLGFDLFTVPPPDEESAESDDEEDD